MDCQLQILENLDVLSLFAMSKTNKHFSSLVVSALNRRFANKQLIIVITNFADETDLRIEETDQYIKIQNIKTSSEILTNFGHVISNLEIEQNLLHSDLTKAIYRLANIHCSETLKQLRLTNPEKIFIDELTKPFKGVESISLRGNHMKVNIGELNFRKIFPAVYRVSLGETDPLFTSLRHLRVPSNPWSANDLIAEKIIVNNPQIRSFVLRNISTHILRLMAERLPLLESLTLHYFSGIYENTDQKIRFKNVKYFKTVFGFKGVAENVIFDNLEIFETDAFPFDSSGWIDFIKSNKKLRKLHVTRELGNEEILRLAAVDSNLTEINASCAMDVEGKSIAELIDNPKQLETLHLTLSGRILLDSVVSILQGRFANKCTWTGVADSNQITIEL